MEVNRFKRCKLIKKFNLQNICQYDKLKTLHLKRIRYYSTLTLPNNLINLTIIDTMCNAIKIGPKIKSIVYRKSTLQHITVNLSNTIEHIEIISTNINFVNYNFG